MHVVAWFDAPDAAARAVGDVRRAGFQPITACAPVFDEALLSAIGAIRTSIPWWALAGALAGALMGLALTIGTVRQWPGLIVGGKPLVSMPPFLIISFVLAILLAAIGVIAGFLIASARARRHVIAACGPPTTDDRFGLMIDIGTSSAGAVATVLVHAGALAWRII
jgi:hypothetical protein